MATVTSNTVPVAANGTQSKPSEGLIPFDVPHAGKECFTWYQVVGNLDFSDAIPLITCHGGPGAGHEYMRPYTELNKRYNIPVILYDQIGCGKATALPEKAGDEAFWTVELFIRELENLIDYLGLRRRGYDFVGHSWGGMLGGVWAARHPAGLRRLILHSAPADIPLMLKGERALVKQMPKETALAIEEGEAKEDYEGDAYKAACMSFYAKHLCRVDPFPADLATSLGHLVTDPTVYKTMYGPSELTATGPLKDFQGWPVAHQIEVPTLLTNGRYDEVQDLSVAPWFQRIPRVKWVQLENSSHCAHYEETDRFMTLVASFLGVPAAEENVMGAIWLGKERVDGKA